MKELSAVLFVLTIILFSCTSNEDNRRDVSYPQIIVDNNVEDLYDRAKWELYKLNYSKFLFHIADTIAEKALFSELSRRQELDEFVDFTKEDLVGILGSKNVIDYLLADLEPFEIDSFRKEDHLLFVFFPRYKGKRFTCLESYYYEVRFSNDTIIALGGGDYFRTGHTKKYSEWLENYFFEQHEQRNKPLNEWIMNYCF